MGIVHWYSKLIPPLCSIDLWWNKLICMLGMLHGHAALVKLYNNFHLWPSLISEKHDLILLFFFWVQSGLTCLCLQRNHLGSCCLVPMHREQCLGPGGKTQKYIEHILHMIDTQPLVQQQNYGQVQSVSFLGAASFSIYSCTVSKMWQLYDENIYW